MLVYTLTLLLRLVVEYILNSPDFISLGNLDIANVYTLVWDNVTILSFSYGFLVSGIKSLYLNNSSISLYFTYPYGIPGVATFLILLVTLTLSYSIFEDHK